MNTTTKAVTEQLAEVQEARMRGTWLWVTDVQGLQHTLPNLSY